MALIDDPRAWILRLFELAEREGHGGDCRRFPDGEWRNGLPLIDDERVYGVYKNKYFFTPQSLLTCGTNEVDRIAWDSICACSSQYGDGKKVCELTLVNGTKREVHIDEMGNRSRISQLFHQMIERHGNRAVLGPRLHSIEEFFAIADNDDCLFPNLEPHPGLQTARSLLEDLRNRSDVADVLLITDFEEGEPICDSLIVRTTMPESGCSALLANLHPDGVLQAAENELRQLRNLRPEENVWHIVWD